jgi:hypothetical protein
MKSTTKVGASRWLQTRKKILQQIKRRVAGHTLKESFELQAYREEYERGFCKKFEPSQINDLMNAISGATVVFGGDFHAFPQAQRMHLKILRRLEPQQKVTIAFEATTEEQNTVVENFLSNKLSEKNFLKKMNWQETWGFPWENYRPLFLLAKERGYRIIGLSQDAHQKSKKLKQRDRRAAQVLKLEQRDFPDYKIYTIFGDLHIASQHLPAELKLLLPKVASLSIFLNPEKIYFKLAEKGLENNIEIVKLSRDQFCVMGSPPWVQWQSYLMYLERSSDEMLSEFEPTDEVRALVGIICSDLKIEISLNDLAVYASHDENFWRVVQGQLTLKETKIARDMIAEGRSLYFPQNGACYLARSTVNHIAELAGLAVHAKLSNRKTFFWNMPHDFEKQIWCEAMSFFMSKLINHKRSSPSLMDLDVKLREVTAGPDHEILKLALDQRMSEILLVHKMRRKKPAFLPRRKTSYLFASRILGSMMGERLYIALQSNKIKLVHINEFLKFDIARSDFINFYLQILWWLEPIQVEMKSRRERL